MRKASFCDVFTYSLRKMKKIVMIIGICVMIILIYNISGYKLTPGSAIKSDFLYEKGSKLVSSVKLDWCETRVYKIKDYYATFTATKYGFLWKAYSNSSLKGLAIQTDKLKTIGWISFSNLHNHPLTVVSIENYDKDVAYIQSDIGMTKVMKKIKTGEIITLHWDKASPPQDLHLVALTKTYKRIYRYGYPENSTISDTKDLKWHKLN